MSRYTTDQKYARTAKAATARNMFCKGAAWKWLKQHHPEIAEAIKAESYRRWPAPKTAGVDKSYQFLAKLQEGDRK